MGKTTAKIIALIAVIAIFLTSCSSGKVAKNTLLVGTPVHNGLYNPLYASTNQDKDICNLIYEGLVTTAPDGVAKINSKIVKELEISEDGLSYTFTLNEGIKFSNGTPLTAHDVVFTYQSLGDPSSTAFYHKYIEWLKGGTSYMFGRTKDFEGVKAVDEQTVVFNFIAKRRDNLEICGVKIISKDYYPNWEHGNVDFVMQDKMPAPMGSGPYILTDISSGESVTLKLNPEYWNKENSNYSIENIVIKFIKSIDVKDEFEKGEINFCPSINTRSTVLEVQHWQTTLGENANLVFESYNNNSYGFLGFNTQGNFTKSANLRQAIAYGFNRQKFVEDYFVSYGERVDAALPVDSDLYKLLAASEGAKDGLEFNKYDYNVEKARELLAEVGYSWSDSGELYLVEDKVELTFLVNVDNRILESLIPQFQEDMKALGITVNIENHTYSEIKKILTSNSNDWNIYFGQDTWHTDDPYNLYYYFSSANISKSNFTRYSNSKVDELLLQGGLKMQEDDEGREIYRRILLQLNSDLPELPMYTSKSTAIYSDNILGIKFGPYQRWSEGLEAATIKEN